MADRALNFVVAPSKGNIVSAVAHEEAGALFRVELEIAGNAPPSLASWIGQRVVASVSISGKIDRYFAGVCTRIAESSGGATPTYRVTLEPSIAPLVRQHRCRVFQDESALDIAKKVLSGYDVAYAVAGAPPRRAYCVQYRESDFEFAQRLLEAEGLTFFFQHTAAGDKMIVTDSAQGAFELGSIPFGAPGGPRIHSFERSQELRAGKVTLRDYVFEHPLLDLTTSARSSAGSAAIEVYDYPGGYTQTASGDRYAQIRVEQETSGAIAASGVSGAATIAAGGKLSLTGSGHGDGAWFVTGAQIEVAQRGEAAPTFNCRFQCIPASGPIRTRRRARKPLIAGVQSAVVCGPPGEIVHTDQYGRMKVQFPWDREGKKDDKSSCWIRIAGLWGGTKHGKVGLPVVGTEVMVAFEEGDPDRPVIVGSVYNAIVMPPAALPQNR
jgi:type VI secretion system secreted protein VgrG